MLCLTIIAEIPPSRAVFDLNNRKSAVNRHLRFCQFPPKLRNVPCVGAYRILTLKYAVCGAMV